MPRTKIQRTIATFDIETDPFLFGRTPEPFAVGFYDGETYAEFWGDDCIEEFISYLEDTDKTFTLYAHNGGRFDFYFLFELLQNPIRIINGRITSARFGRHNLRDSYAILPLPLREYDKGSIDFDKLERKNREKFRGEISTYLKRDCTSLYDWVQQFRARFGDKLTVGSAAIKELEKFHPFERQGSAHDEKFRPYYFGGRVEAFRSGIHSGEWSIYDVNSMYPFVMSNFDHPTGRLYEFTTDLSYARQTARPFFIQAVVISKGAFPVRTDNAPLQYPNGAMEIATTSHELNTAIRLGLCEVIHVNAIYVASETIRFSAWVEHFTKEKIAAKKAGNRALELFAKLMLNSAYGKFGSNPENYYDYEIHRPGDFWPGANWEIHFDYGNFLVLRTPARNRGTAYFDVATAASITGAARSVLLEALHDSKNVIYCDTDSIICEKFNGRTNDTELGAWKLECSGTRIAIGGKKLYSLVDSNGIEQKQAAKGVQLTTKEIFDIANGERIITDRQAPTFSLSRPKGDYFVTRQIRSR